MERSSCLLSIFVSRRDAADIRRRISGCVGIATVHPAGDAPDRYRHAMTDRVRRTVVRAAAFALLAAAVVLALVAERPVVAVVAAVAVGLPFVLPWTWRAVRAAT